MELPDLKVWLVKNRPVLSVLALLVLVVYFNSLGNTFVADDVPGILNNPNITKTSYIFSNPLTLVKNILYFTLVSLFGRSATAFRITNLIFHLGNVWLLFLLIERLLDRRTAILAAAILAVHPLQTEAVTWISGGQYVRYSFFLLLALVFYVLADESPGERFYWAALGSFIVALLNSEKAMVFPLIILTLEVACQTIRESWRRLVVPFALSGIWALIFVGKIGQRVADVQTRYYQPPQTINPLLQIPVAISSYLKLIFWPKDLTLYHSEMSFSITEFYLMVAVLLAFVGLVVYAYKKSKPVFFWLSFFIIALLPVLTPFGISWIVAERYVYLGAMGIFAVVAIALRQVIETVAENPRYQKHDRTVLFYVVLFLLLLPLTVRTIVRNNDWRTADTLWLAAARTSPSSPQNHNNLGDLYGRRGDLVRSEQEFKRAIELNPNYADAYHNLGNTYRQMGRLDEALAAYKKAAELNPNLWQSYQNIAAIYFEEEAFSESREYLQKAVEANPQNVNLYLNLAVVNLRLGDIARARKAAQAAFEIDPQNPAVLQFLAGLEKR